MKSVISIGRKLLKSYLRLRTLLYVKILQLLGRRIKIGKGTIFASGAIINPGNGVIIMGKNCFVGSGTIIRAYEGKICFGNSVSVGQYCILHGRGKIYIGDHGLLATHISLIPATHNFDRRDMPIRRQGNKPGKIWMEQDVWIGSGVRVLDKVHIGKGAIVGAGAVVTKPLEPYGIYAGNPAVKIKDRP